MITSQEKSQIKALIHSPQWATIERVADLLVEKIQEEIQIKDNEWETIKSLLQSEGKKEGIKRFLQELMLQASE